MGTFIQILYQIVFSPKHRAPVMKKENREELFKYLHGILKSKNCYSYQINGVEDHLHLVFSLHPSVALADLVKDMKVASSKFIKKKNLFPGFTGWQVGYGAFTYSIEAKDNLVRYVKNQEEHHRIKTFKQEYIELLQEHEVEWKEEYLF